MSSRVVPFTRRRLLAMMPLLPLPGIALATSKVVPANSQANELTPGRQYLIKLPFPIPEEDARTIEQSFLLRGVNVILVGGDFEIFDLGAERPGRELRVL